MAILREAASLGPGQTKRYSTIWTVPATAKEGEYIGTVGNFTPGWGKVYDWNVAAATFSAARSPQPRLRLPSTLDGSLDVISVGSCVHAISTTMGSRELHDGDGTISGNASRRIDQPLRPAARQDRIDRLVGRLL